MFGPHVVSLEVGEQDGVDCINLCLGSLLGVAAHVLSHYHGNGDKLLLGNRGY